MLTDMSQALTAAFGGLPALDVRDSVEECVVRELEARGLSGTFLSLRHGHLHLAADQQNAFLLRLDEAAIISALGDATGSPVRSLKLHRPV